MDFYPPLSRYFSVYLKACPAVKLAFEVDSFFFFYLPTWDTEDKLYFILAS